VVSAPPEAVGANALLGSWEFVLPFVSWYYVFGLRLQLKCSS
jgi:hypothetical protein